MSRYPRCVALIIYPNTSLIFSGAAGTSRAARLVRIVRRAAAATAFYFAKSRKDRGLAGLTPYGAAEYDEFSQNSRVTIDLRNVDFDIVGYEN